MVKSTGVVRKVDELGRVILPIETRRIFGIEEKDSLEILVNEDSGQIILQKASKVCFKCGGAEGLKEIKTGYHLCYKCISELK